MRTTIKLDDAVFRAFKLRAAERGTSFAQEVEDALRAELAGRGEEPARERYAVPVFRGARPVPGVDLNSNAALLDVIDAVA